MHNTNFHRWLCGEALFNLERYEDAIITFDHVIRLQSDRADIYFKKGQTQLKLQRYEEALSSYNQAISLNPKRSYYLAKAEAHDALARQAREKAQELDAPQSALKTT